MTHRYALAAVMLAAFAIPAAAQQTDHPADTSKKTTTRRTVERRSRRRHRDGIDRSGAVAPARCRPSARAGERH